MAFHRIGIMDVWDIIRRWHDRHTISQITEATGYDRKTVRGYIHLAVFFGLSLEEELPPKDDVLAQLHNIKAGSGRQPSAQLLLLPYLNEIVDLVKDKKYPITPKSAFFLVQRRHEDVLGTVSYPSFKRFARAHRLTFYPSRGTCGRVEVAPGTEVQVDYGRMGMFNDPATPGRRKVLLAFIGTLSHSRMKYVELVFGQDQRAFAAAHIRMFEFFGGVPLRIVPDNLKAGVIKPDLYDPTINILYREMADHYGTFIDPARPAHPKDKPKVERDVQTVREAVHVKLLENPTATLAELNRLMRKWSEEEYGLNPHGTTGERPFIVLQERERPAFRPLPSEPFELADWKQATVHPDHYVQFHHKAFSVPHAYVGQTVWIRATEHILQVIVDHQVIKQHVITTGFRHTDYSDFPENVRAVRDTSRAHQRLLERAGRCGPVFHQLVDDLLAIHAFSHLRCAQGLVGAAEHSTSHVVEHAARFMLDHCIKATPKNFRHLLARLTQDEQNASVSSTAPLPISPATGEFIRDISYFISTTTTSDPLP